ncbi:unnamed protein product, partial [Dibothriocephalus latus]
MIMSLLEKQPSNRLPLEELESTLLANHRPALIPEDLGFTCLRDLLISFPFVQILRLPPTASYSPSASEELLGGWQENAVDDEGLAEGSGDNSDQTVVGEKDVEKGEQTIATALEPAPVETETEKDDCLEAATSRQTEHSPSPLLPPPPLGGCEKPREILCLTDRSHIKQLAYRCLQLLFGSPFCSLQEAEFKRRFVQSFNEEVNLDCIKREMGDFIQSTGETSGDEVDGGNNAIPVTLTGTAENYSIATSTQIIALTPIIVFARQLRTLLLRTRGRMMLALLETIYHSTFGLPLRPEAYGYPSISTLVGAVSFIAVIRGRGARATLFLAQDYL